MAALDQVGRGIVLTAEDGSVTYANARAEAVFGQGDGLSGGRRGLQSGRSGIDAQLHRMVHDAARTGYGRASVAVGAMAVARASGKAPYTVIAEPLAPAHRERLGAPSQSGAVLFIGDSAADQAPSAARLAAIYSLTPMESQIASRAASGLGATEIAQLSGHSVNTVKSHLKEVFRKVGVEKLPQLVARIAADAGGVA
jgi:DNA-binding CsgD family transcriptional regulator